jgi:hypothetical protein
MRASLSLQQSLYRRQQQKIRQLVVGASPAFRRYEAQYRRATQSFRRRLGLAEVHQQLLAADVVYVGDYHTLKAAQQGYLELITAAVASGRRVVLALELVEGKHQAQVDALISGRIKARTFLDRIGHPYRGAFDVWPHFEPIFDFARTQRLEVTAIDRRSSGSRSLQVRDAYAAKRIAALARADDRPLVLVLMGQFHVAPDHLPAKVKRELGAVDRQHLVIYQNAEGVYWALAREGRADSTRAVEVRPGELCLISSSPVVCQQSFLDYVEAELGDAPLEERGAPAAFRHLAKVIGELVGVDVTEALEEVQVVTPGTLGSGIWERRGFSRAEIKALEDHVLSRESAYVPRAKLAYLASLSLNHAAEEAAHFVRHVCVGKAMEAPRPRAEAFFARCLEEALGFFGSRLVNGARRCMQISEWSELFSRGSAEQRRIAAFVLALKAAEADEPAEAKRLVPPDDKLFHAVSHALGYLLGEALFRAFDSGRLHPNEVRGLFTDPFRHAAERYFALCARLFAAGRTAPLRAGLLAAHG